MDKLGIFHVNQTSTSVLIRIWIKGEVGSVKHV